MITMENSACTDTKTDNIPDGTSDEECRDPDPRIQIELDRLNTASTDINRLENELDEARSKYRSIVSGTSGQMEVIAHGRKKSIQRAREYYRLSVEAKLAQSEALKAARQYQTAVGVYNAAKETVTLAEGRLIENANTAAAQLTSACQEMLNHAISKVAEAEKEKAKSEHNHKRRSEKYAELQAKIQVQEKKFGRSIKKAKQYFELKAELDVKLMQQKQNVSDIQTAIRCCKMKYTDSLRKLESISEEIHQSRRERFWSKIPRMPGVGADNDSEASGLSEIDLKSLVSSDLSEYGDEFDTEDVTDDEVFDMNYETERRKNNVTQAELRNKIDSLNINEPNLRANKNGASQTTWPECDNDIRPDETEMIANKISKSKDETNVNKDIDEKEKTHYASSASDSGINIGNSSECESTTIRRNERSVRNEKQTADNNRIHLKVEEDMRNVTEEGDYTGCNMQSIERPSLSGAED